MVLKYVENCQTHNTFLCNIWKFLSDNFDFCHMSYFTNADHSDISWAFQITSNSTFYWTTDQTNKQNVKAPHSWTFERRIYWYTMDSHHKGPAMQKAYPCHEVIMHIKSTYLFNRWVRYDFLLLVSIFLTQLYDSGPRHLYECRCLILKQVAMTWLHDIVTG